MLICIYFSMHMFNSGYALNYYVMFSQKKNKKEYINYSLHNWHLGDKNYVIADGSASKESARNAGDKEDASWIPGLGRSPGEGNGNPPQYACLENPMYRGSWWATVHGVPELDMTEQLSTWQEVFMVLPGYVILSGKHTFA